MSVLVPGGSLLVMNQPDILGHQPFAVEMAFKFDGSSWTQILAVLQFVGVDHYVRGLATSVVQESIAFIREPSLDCCLHSISPSVIHSLELYQIALHTRFFDVVRALVELAD